jgi:Orange carotenoid protein, N-terminal
MTATNSNAMTEAKSNFFQLEMDDRLAVLASLYTQVAGTVPADAFLAMPEKGGADLVKEVQHLSGEEKLFALRDILAADRNDQDETMLDPNPSKALGELLKGGTKVHTGKYGAMKSESKLGFWYQLAQSMGSSIPTDYKPSSQATELVNSLKSMSTEDLVSFLTKVV